MLSIRSCGANWKNRLSLLNRCTMVWNGKIPWLAQFSTSMASTDNILMVRSPTMPKQQLRSICCSNALRNSSSNPTTTTNLDDSPGEQEEEAAQTDEPMKRSIRLAEKQCRYGEPPTWLTIRYEQGKSGQKHFHLFKKIQPTQFYNFANVLVPEDVVGFARAMDELLGAVDGNRAKIEANRKQQRQPIVLHTAKATGLNYDFQLELRLGRFLDVLMRTVPNAKTRGDHNQRNMNLPLRQFHWLRLRIGEMLAEGGDKQLAEQLGEPPRLPAWIGQGGFPQASPPNNVRTQQQQSQPSGMQTSNPAQLQQLLLQLVLQQQQQLQQMQTNPNGWQQNSGGFGGFNAASNVPQVPVDPTAVLLSNLLAQTQQQQQAQTAPLIQPQSLNNEQHQLANLLQQLQTNQNNSGGQ